MQTQKTLATSVLCRDIHCHLITLESYRIWEYGRADPCYSIYITKQCSVPLLLFVSFNDHCIAHVVQYHVQEFPSDQQTPHRGHARQEERTSRRDRLSVANTDDSELSQ